MNKFVKFQPYITALFVFIVYLFTLAPSVVQIDSGELAAVQATGGIAHPTGYPLYTMLGYLFLSLPLPFTKIFAANLLAAIYCSAGIFFFSKWVTAVLVRFRLPGVTDTTKGNKPAKDRNINAQTVYAISDYIIALVVTGGALLLAFSKTFWFQGTSVEVYSLHILTINIVLFTLINAYHSDGSLKYWLIFAVTLAFSFANHMTTILIIPGTALLYFNREKFNPVALKKLGLMLLVFFPVLAVLYSYLPLRAATYPLLNWGNPADFEHFWRHFMGKQYQVWLFESADSAKEQLAYFFNNFPGEFFYAGLALIIPGVYLLFRFNKVIGWFALITFWSVVLYSINYNISDIDSYFLLAYIICGFWAATGLLFYYGILKKFGNEKLTLPVFTMVILLITAAGNFGKVNQSKVYIYEDYTKAILDYSEDNALILSYQWDYFISPSYYFMYVENVRPDIKLVDKELLRRSWYYTQLETNYPEIFTGVHKDIAGFLEAVKPFERDEDYNPTLIEKHYRNIMTGLIRENLKKGPVYLAPELVENEVRRGDLPLPGGTTFVPYGFLYKVVSTIEYVDAPFPDYRLRYTGPESYYKDNISRFVLLGLLNRASYEKEFGYIDKAKKYINKIKQDYPGYNRVPAQLTDIW